MSYENTEYETHDVKIGSVQPLEKHLNVTFQVIEKSEEREISNRSGETHRVCDFRVADDSGNIILTLWNEDIDMIEIDKVYKLSNGFANVFQNSLRLSKGKFGELSEDSTSFDEVDTENNRSEERVEDPRRKYGRRSYGGGGDRRSSYGGGGDRRSSYGGGRRDRDRKGSSRGRYDSRSQDRY